MEQRMKELKVITFIGGFYIIGGIVLCCTWKAIHILSKGSIFTGLGVMVFALLYGCMYLLLNRNAKYSYLAMAVAFMI